MRDLVPDAFPVPITERAERAIAWLERQVGLRYQGWAIDANGAFAVDVLKPGSTTELERFSGETLEKALDEARARVSERARDAAAVRLRRPSPALLVTIARRGEPAAFAIARALETVDP
jgi:hypothetical protein